MTPEQQLANIPRSIGDDIYAGMIAGLILGVLFALVAAIQLGRSAVPRGEFAEPFKIWLLAALFYCGAGALGGLIHSLLRPIQDRYWGQFLTAYLILFLVYGGGTTAFWPMMSGKGVSLGAMLLVWAVLCLLLAPIYIVVTRRPSH